MSYANEHDLSCGITTDTENSYVYNDEIEDILDSDVLSKSIYLLRCSISLYCGIFKKLHQEQIKLINSLENKFKQIKEYIQKIVSTNFEPNIVSRINYSFSQINEIVKIRKIIKT